MVKKVNNNKLIDIFRNRLLLIFHNTTNFSLKYQFLILMKSKAYYVTVSLFFGFIYKLYYFN